MEAQNVGPGEQFVQGDVLHPQLQSFVPLAHVVGDDMHPQGRCDGGSVDADVPAAKQAVCLSRQLDQGVVPVAPVRALFPFPALYRIIMITDVMADFKQQGDGKLADGMGAVDRHVGDRDALLFCAGYVDHVIAGGQHGDEAHGGTGVHHSAGDGGLVGEDHLRTADPGDDLVLIGEAGAVVNRQVSQLLQFSPAEIAGVFRVSVQNDDVHFIPPVCVSPGPQGPGDSRFHWKVSRIAAVPAERRTWRPDPRSPAQWRG